MVYLAAVAAFASGCAVSRKHVVPPGQVRPALDATKDQLLAQYNEQARAIQSLNAAVNLVPTAGSTYSGVIEEYHDVNGFVLAERPAFIRLIGQAPVVAKDVFDMVSDGETFRIFIPSKHKFIVGSTAMTRPAKKPIENLRPQHLLDAFFWPEIPPGATVLFEEWDASPDRYYALTVVQKDEIERKVWFNRADLSIARLEIYASGGRLISDIRYEDWQPVEAAGAVRFPRRVWLARPHDDYQIKIQITKLAVNEPIPADRFQLAQPPGTELVRVGEGAAESHP
jgi:outer membrane lipoprotein-sorting protein